MALKVMKVTLFPVELCHPVELPPFFLKNDSLDLPFELCPPPKMIRKDAI